MLLTKYFIAKITGEGYKIKNNKEIADAILDNDVVRMNDLLTMFKKGITGSESKRKNEW